MKDYKLKQRNLRASHTLGRYYWEPGVFLFLERSAKEARSMLGGGERAWRRQLIALAATGAMVLLLGVATLSSAGRRPFSLVGKQSSISDHP